MRKIDSEELKAHQREYSRKYRETHREHINSVIRKWRSNHPDKVWATEKRYRAAHPETMAAKKEKFKLDHPHYAGECYRRDPDSHKARVNKYKYGITPEEHDQLFVKQDGRCAICGKDQCEIKKPLGIDHDHITGKIRGLLCDDCNNMIGRAHDNTEILMEAVVYLGIG